MKLKYPCSICCISYWLEVQSVVLASQGCSKEKKNKKLPENHFDNFGLIRIIFPPWAVLCPPEDSCRSKISQLWFLKSNPCSHQVNHGTWVPYQPWSWWANLALRGFSLLKAITADSVSTSWLPLRPDEPLTSLYLFISLLRCCTPSP